MAKGRATRDTSNNESFHRMSEHRGNERQNEISKPWSCPRAMKDNIEVRLPKNIS